MLRWPSKIFLQHFAGGGALVKYGSWAPPPQVLVVGDPAPGKGSSQVESRDAPDGITPPMRNARTRVFKRQYDVEPDLVSKVEHNLLTILAVGGG